VSGFAIYKPTQLSLLTTLMGGYESARFIHWLVTIGFLAFFVIHLLQVARAGFGNFWSMVTGYELIEVESLDGITTSADETTTDHAADDDKTEVPA
jgi:hypothetical protein